MENNIKLTAYEWFIRVKDEELRNKLLFNLNHHSYECNKNSKFYNFGDALRRSFVWSDTEEKHEYWSNKQYYSLNTENFYEYEISSYSITILEYLRSIKDCDTKSYLLKYLNTDFENEFVSSLGEAIIKGCSRNSYAISKEILRIHNDLINIKNLQITYVEEKFDLKYDDKLLPW